MVREIAVIPGDAHLDAYLEYPRRAHPLMKAVFVKGMIDGLAAHEAHELPSICVFRRLGSEADASRTRSSGLARRDTMP